MLTTPKKIKCLDSRRKNIWAHLLVQVTIYRRLRIGRDDHLDQSEAYDILCHLNNHGDRKQCVQNAANDA